MKYLIIATALAILAGCAEMEQNAAQGGSASGYARQDNHGYPYNAPYP
jgi:uncharacterized lipoprotein YajG